MTRPLTAPEAARSILSATERGDECVSVLATRGVAAGARVVVAPDLRVAGTLGSETLDGAAVELARSVFSARTPQLAGDLFGELHAPAEKLVIFGAGHIAVPLADLAVKLGFLVTVLDDREEFASRERFPGDAAVRVLDLENPLADLTIDRFASIVLVTRSHKHDFDLLRAILQRPETPRYIGMIGSRRRVRAAFTALLEDGVSREKLARVHAPIGIDIGAETPAEIAVSIAAELVRVRRGGSAQLKTDEERVLERFFPEPAS